MCESDKQASGQKKTSYAILTVKLQPYHSIIQRITTQLTSVLSRYFEGCFNGIKH